LASDDDVANRSSCYRNLIAQIISFHRQQTAFERRDDISCHYAPQFQRFNANLAQSSTS
jgi:hypothetical protein